VLREVFSIASAQELTPKGENALHVAVKHNQYKALEACLSNISWRCACQCQR
jgi:hypothetical protein